MRIIIFTHAAGSPEYGPNMRWYYLGKRFVELGCEVTIVGSSYFHKYVKSPQIKGWCGEWHNEGMRFIFLKNLSYRGILGRLINQFFFPLISFFWIFRCGGNNSYDIVIASSPPPFCVFPAKLLARKNKAPLIYEVRDLWPMVIQELSNASSLHPYIMLLKATERYAVKHSRLVVSVKPGDYYYFITEYGLHENKFSWQPNGFLPEDRVVEKLNSKNTKKVFTVGYVGAMSAYYGLEELLFAAEQLKSDPLVRFVLVGGGDDYQMLLNIKKQKRLDNVHFVGKVSKKEVPFYLNSFDMCYVGLKDVKANLHGISCNKVFEYMYASKPIIASYRTWFDPVKEAGCGITVVPGQPSLIVSAIRALRDNPDKCCIMGNKARQYFECNHNFSVIGDRYLTKLKKLVEV